MLKRMIKNIWSLRSHLEQQNKTLKGTDQYNNKYYEFIEDNQIKRKIEYSEDNHQLLYDQEFWQEWLNHQTAEPYTQHDIQRMMQERSRRQIRNKQFDQQEELIHQYNLKNNIK